ncbi:hypothetical protein, partial [Escherichia coli]|uniref:hypothetical protein n=1 Tax=Escherichia coli TaxID=562 RepID=UPI0013D320F8
VIRVQWFAARERVKDLRGSGDRLNAYASAIERIQALMAHVDDVSLIEKAVMVMRAERDKLAFDQLFDRPELAEAKGQR